MKWEGEGEGRMGVDSFCTIKEIFFDKSINCHIGFQLHHTIRSRIIYIKKTSINGEKPVKDK